MGIVPILPSRRDDGDRAESGNQPELHLLSGVCIDHNGPANVSKYFSPTLQDTVTDSSATDGAGGAVTSVSQQRTGEQVERLTGSFRGRLLRGARVSCEDGYKFYVIEKEPTDDVHEDDDDEGEADPKERTGGAYRVVGSTKTCTYWKHHVPVDPSTDALYRAIKWVNVAGALHGD